MASEIRHNSTTKPILVDSAETGVQPADAFFGPWGSIGEFNSWWDEMFVGQTIPVGVVIGIVNGTNVDRYCRIAPTDGTAYWRKLDYINSIIEFGGIVSEVSVSSGTVSTMGSRATVFYDEAAGILVLKNGSSYYGNWTNSYDYGEIDGSRVYPYEGKVYVDITTGQLFYATSNELEPYEGGSGISSELLAELIRLKQLNIRFSGNLLTIYDASSGTDKTYNLERGGSEGDGDFYDDVDISLSYSASIDSSAQTLSPTNIEVTQDYVPEGGSSNTLTYTTVASLKKAAGSGNVTFEMGAGSDPAFSVNSNGVVSVSENNSGSTRTATVKVTVTLNGKTGTYTTEAITQNIPRLYITAVEYPEPDALDNYTSGNISVASSDIDITDSEGETYSLATYLAKSTTVREEVSFECKNGLNYGAELNGSTGELTYNPKSILTNFSTYTIQSGDGAGAIGSVGVVVKQNNHTDITVLFDMFTYSSMTSLENATVVSGIGGSASEGGNATQIQNKDRCSTITGISVTANDIVLVEFPDAGTWKWIWETTSNITGPGTATRGIRSSSFGTSALFKIVNTGKLSLGYFNDHKPVAYKVVTVPE